MILKYLIKLFKILLIKYNYFNFKSKNLNLSNFKIKQIKIIFKFNIFFILFLSFQNID